MTGTPRGERRRDLPGAVYVDLPGAGGELAAARTRRDILLSEGVSFPTCPAGELPWLMALEPFTMDPGLTQRVEALGAAVFAFIDAVQGLYAEGHPEVREQLDTGVPSDLRGLDLDKPVNTFRLDMVLEGGAPVITEIEEVYGNAGKAHAMQAAYGVPYDGLFQAFGDLGLTHVLVDDQVRTYGSELAIFRERMRSAYGRDVEVMFFSKFRPKSVAAAWRFCYTLDLAQYDEAHRKRITRSGIRFVNPLFHGYGTKMLTALPFLPGAAGAIRERMSAGLFEVLVSGMTECWRVDPGALAEDLVSCRKHLVVKVAESSADRSATWGSRGVYFGEASGAAWARVLDAVRGGHLPGRPGHPAVFLAARLIDSDRFDVPFLHPGGERLGVMTKARIRLAPVFFRTAGQIRLVAGHATFVNTSRKVHMGRHAVCAPLAWSAEDK